MDYDIQTLQLENKDFKVKFKELLDNNENKLGSPGEISSILHRLLPGYTAFRNKLAVIVQEHPGPLMVHPEPLSDQGVQPYDIMAVVEGMRPPIRADIFRFIHQNYGQFWQGIEAIANYLTTDAALMRGAGRTAQIDLDARKKLLITDEEAVIKAFRQGSHNRLT